LVSVIELTAIVSAAAALFLTVFAVIQLRHVEKHRNVDISMKLFEWSESDRLRKAFRWIENEFEFESIDKYKAEAKANLDAGDYPYEVVAFFEQVGFLVEKKFVDLDVIDDRLGPFIVSNWRKLEPWITALRNERKDDTFGEHFQRLYDMTQKYLQKQ